MPDTGPAPFSPDRPITSENEDTLGFRSIAERLATSILSQAAEGGLVVGLEGQWGSGKSSILNLLATHLMTVETDAEISPLVLHFAPWIVSDRDAMLGSLMSDIANAIEAASDQTGTERAKRVANKLRSYTSKITKGLASLATTAELLGVPYADLAKKVLDSSSALLDGLETKKSVADLKAELVDDLKEIKSRIIVVIDDLDRLEPAEIAEVMRLVRAVADFPNVIYVLSYDPRIIAASINAALQIDDGTSYLRKIVQVGFKVPRPESFDLRNWLLKECLAINQGLTSKELSSDTMERLNLVCQVEGGQLQTPRDVVRVLNLVKLYWPPIVEHVDFADLVWLQIIKAQDEQFYNFIERYLGEFSSLASGAFIAESELAQFYSEFKSFVTEDSFSPRALYTLKMFLPGLHGIKEKPLFNISDAEIASFARDRRLASPDHFRYFFAFSTPAGALSDADFRTFFTAASAGKNLEKEFSELIYQRRPQGGLMLGLIIDRLTHRNLDALSIKAVCSISMLLADSLDEAGRLSGRADFGRIPSWSDGHRLLAQLLRNLSVPDRKRLLGPVFRQGKSMGWLMSYVLRHEIFSHGRFGDQQEQEHKWLLSDAELDAAIKTWIRRAGTTEKDYIANSPDLLSVMFGWQQSGNDATLQKWIRAQTSSDATFLKMLNGCRGWMQSDKTYYPLRQSDIESLIDYDAAMRRLAKISKSKTTSPEHQALALELLEAAELGRKRTGRR